MRQRNKFIIAGAILLISVVTTAYLLGRSSPPSIPEIDASRIKELWETRYADLNGQPQPLTQWHGKIVVVNFWAAWCPPCRAEMPDFSNLQQHYRAKGVQFVGIGTDSPYAQAEFLENQPVDYPTLNGGEAAFQLMRSLNNPRGGLPHTLVFDQSGKLRASRLGLMPKQELDAILQQLSSK